MKKKRIGTYITLTLFVLFFLFPIVYTLTNSFMSTGEIEDYYRSGSMVLHFVPDQVSLEAYYQVLLRRPNYLNKFAVSLLLSSAIVFGQVLISLLAGYAFAKFKFKGRDVIFFFVILIMMMPYQVTLVTNYIVLDKLGLIGSYAAVLLLAIFSPFGVFLMRQVIAGTSDEIIEAAKLDGASHLQVLFRVVAPCNKSGVISLIILSFIDSWNMVEQPLIFLKDEAKYPLSIFLARVNASEPGVAFAWRSAGDAAGCAAVFVL